MYFFGDREGDGEREVQLNVMIFGVLDKIASLFCGRLKLINGSECGILIFCLAR